MREYRERIRDAERADFNPPVFICSDGMAPQSHLVLKRLAESMRKKLNLQLHSVVSGWLRCKLSFVLLRTTLLCVRATRRKREVYDNNIELTVQLEWSTKLRPVLSLGKRVEQFIAMRHRRRVSGSLCGLGSEQVEGASMNLSAQQHPPSMFARCGRDAYINTM